MGSELYHIWLSRYIPHPKQSVFWLTLQNAAPLAFYLPFQVEPQIFLDWCSGVLLAGRDSALPEFLSRTGSSPGSQRKDVHRTLPLLYMEEGKPGAILHTAAVDSF